MAVVERLKRIVSVTEWNIGLADLELERLASVDRGTVDAFSPRVRWLDKPWFLSFQADPCLVEDEGRVFLYYEAVRWGSTSGSLRCAELTAEGLPVRPGTSMMRLRGHAAYPYVFKYRGAFYCVPETNTSNHVALYQADGPLGPWILQSVLLEGFSAYDSTVFRFDGRWWLFCTAAGADQDASVTNLHIWHASEPWGPWEPHGLQPAKKDVHSARPAGRPFCIDGVLYRPAQDCVPRYGARIVINRVLALTPEHFEEEVCSYLEPDPFGPYAEGLHTVSSAGGVVLIDGCRKRVTLNLFKTTMAFIFKLRGKL